MFLRYVALVFLTLLLNINSNQAQIAAPNLICVKADTLIWQLPQVNCGTITGYQIFASQSLNGTYSLLKTISNPNQTAFFHDHSPLETWFYYMQTQATCNGQFQLNSDTLDNKPPITKPIKSVSVVNNKAVIEWIPSPSPEAFAYIVYKNTNLGTVPIDTVYTGLKYTDPSSKPDQTQEAYYVIVMDACGNTGLFDKPQKSIRLRSSIDKCKQTAKLNWDFYENWTPAVKNYQIWLSLNGAAKKMVATVSNTDSVYTYSGLNRGDKLCFTVKAIQESTGYEAESIEHCFTADVTQPIRNLILENVSVNPKNDVEITWNWESNADIKTSIIKTGGTSLEKTLNYTLKKPLTSSNTYIDSLATPDKGKIYYQIQATDECNISKSSNWGASIFLKGIPQPNLTNKLIWTELDIQNATILEYEIYRVLDNKDKVIGLSNPSDTTFVDEVNLLPEADKNLCYYVVGIGLIKMADGRNKTIYVRSNPVCIEQFASIQVPNAFAPNGKNQEFKPITLYSEAAEYQMIIFNRWGEKIFETTNLSDGWNGKYKGKDLEQGAYLYFIRLKQANGKLIEKKGTVVLIR